MSLFIRAARRYNALEKIPAKTASRHELYHSERHMLDRIGDHPAVNVSGFARSAGITKGAVSQVVKKLETKGLVRRYKSGGNNKEVFLELTKSGRDEYLRHQEKNQETIGPLLRELRKYPDDKVEFLITMLAWISGYLETSAKQMKEKH